MAVMDPLLIFAVVACVRIVARLCDAWAQSIVLHSRAQWARSAASVPAGTCLAERDTRGTAWQLRTAPARQGGKS